MVQRKTNPRTLITEVQKSWEADCYHRLIRSDDERHTPVRTAIRERVVEEDALGLQTITLQFDFPENPRKAADFEEWLQNKLDAAYLERMGRSGVVDGGHWTGEYVRASSQQGVKHADRELRRVAIDVDDESVGAVLRSPVHTDILESAYLRAYDELEGVSSDMGREISRVMSDGLGEGWNPRKTARAMTERVDVGMTRSRRVARTEASRAYSQHTAARYSDHGIEKVKILTYNPCDSCADLAAGGPYPIEEAGSLIPNRTHPSCVCALEPVVN